MQKLGSWAGWRQNKTPIHLHEKVEFEAAATLRWITVGLE